MKIYPVSLGCPKNQSILEERLELIRNYGHEIVSDPSIADVALINSCTFIAPATIESVETTISLKNSYPHLSIVFTGCVVQRYGKENVREELPEVDVVLDPEDLEKWKEFFSTKVSGDEIDRREYPHIPFTLTFPYAYVHVAHGCSSACTYCTIPSFKGQQRSLPIRSIVDKVKRLEEAGYREVILVAQDVAAYGLDSGTSLPELLRYLHNSTKEILFRLLYLNPKYFRPYLIKQVSAFERVVPYFDVPVQHLHTEVLKLMNRGYGYKEIIEMVDSIYKYWKDPAIRTTLMVGFPGETEEYFNFMKKEIINIPFDWIGVFEFIPEEGTVAYNMEQLNPQIKHQRYEELLSVVSNYVEKRAMRWIGKRSKAIVTEIVSYDNGITFDVGYPVFCAPEIDKLVQIKNGDISDIGKLVDIVIEDYKDDVYVARIG